MESQGDFIRRDIEVAIGDVESLRQDIAQGHPELEEIAGGVSDTEFRGDAERIADFAARAEELCERIRTLLEELEARRREGLEPRQGQALAFNTTAAVQSLRDELAWLEATLERLDRQLPQHEGWLSQLKGKVRSAKDWVRLSLMPRLKRILSRVWQIVANLITPKEWKVRGSVGTGLLGLGQVEIEITFGP